MAESSNNLDFRVDIRIIPPVALAMLLGLWIIALESHSERFLIMVVILAPFYYLGAEILTRKIALDSGGITIRKLFRSSEIPWNDILYVDSLRAGKKVFLIIESSSAKPALLTNTLGQFPKLVNSIIQRLPTDKISESARELTRDLPNKYGPLLQAWAICILLSCVLVGKLLGYG